MLFHRLACRLIGLRILETGQRPHDVPVLILSNHSSWMDIVALGALRPGLLRGQVGDRGLARLRHAGAAAAFDLHRPGRSSRRRGRRLRVSPAGSHGVNGSCCLQRARPATETGSIRFAHPWSAPPGWLWAGAAGGGEGPCAKHCDCSHWPSPICAVTACRFTTAASAPDLCWYGRMDLIPHLAGILSGGPIDVLIHWGEPLAFEAGSNRKQLTREAWEQVRRAVSEANAGRFEAADASGAP